MKARHVEAARVRDAGEAKLWVDPIDPWPASYFRADVAEILPPLQRCAAEFLGVEEIRTRSFESPPREILGDPLSVIPGGSFGAPGAP